MNRRIALVIAVVGLNLMACCCGGVTPNNAGGVANPKQKKKEKEKEQDPEQLAKAAEENQKKQEEAARKAEEEFDVSGLVLLRKTVKGTQTQLGMEITGTVENRRKGALGYAQITFNVYDDSGAQVGSALANINGLEPGGRWNFKAVSLRKGTTYKFSKLSGF